MHGSPFFSCRSLLSLQNTVTLLLFSFTLPLLNHIAQFNKIPSLYCPCFAHCFD
jgi:hypothetical protein